VADKPKNQQEPKRAVCPGCGGRKTVAWADGTIVCGTCGGKGTVKA